jgi:hypothetical protein
VREAGEGRFFSACEEAGLSGFGGSVGMVRQEEPPWRGKEEPREQRKSGIMQ